MRIHLHTTEGRKNTPVSQSTSSVLPPPLPLALRFLYLSVVRLFRVALSPSSSSQLLTILAISCSLCRRYFSVKDAVILIATALSSPGSGQKSPLVPRLLRHVTRKKFRRSAKEQERGREEMKGEESRVGSAVVLSDTHADDQFPIPVKVLMLHSWLSSISSPSHAQRKKSRQ